MPRGVYRVMLSVGLCRKLPKAMAKILSFLNMPFRSLSSPVSRAVSSLLMDLASHSAPSIERQFCADLLRGVAVRCKCELCAFFAGVKAANDRMNPCPISYPTLRLARSQSNKPARLPYLSVSISLSTSSRHSTAYRGLIRRSVDLPIEKPLPRFGGPPRWQEPTRELSLIGVC